MNAPHFLMLSHCKPPAEQRVPGVSDLDLYYIPNRRVLEGGIN